MRTRIKGAVGLAVLFTTAGVVSGYAFGWANTVGLVVTLWAIMSAVFYTALFYGRWPWEKRAVKDKKNERGSDGPG